jgi:hypothetical protein
MPELKLIAFDADDLAVMSAHLQDALLKIGDIAYLPREQRFAAIGNRFDWADAITSSENGSQEYLRRRAALRFERVLGARLQGIDLAKKDTVVSLLAISYEPSEAPAGNVTLHFADGGAIRLQVECIEAELKDLGSVWRVASMPKHAIDDSPPARET